MKRRHGDITRALEALGAGSGDMDTSPQRLGSRQGSEAGAASLRRAETLPSRCGHVSLCGSRPPPAPLRRRLRAGPQDGVPQRLRGSSHGHARGGRRTTSRGASTPARAPSPCSATAAPCSPSGPRPRPAPATTPLLIGIGHAARGCDDEAPSPCAAPKGGPRHGARPTKTFRREPPLAPHYKRLESESVFEPAKALHPGFCTQGRITPPSTRPPSPFPYSRPPTVSPRPPPPGPTHMRLPPSAVCGGPAAARLESVMGGGLTP